MPSERRPDEALFVQVRTSPPPLLCTFRAVKLRARWRADRRPGRGKVAGRSPLGPGDYAKHDPARSGWTPARQRLPAAKEALQFRRRTK